MRERFLETKPQLSVRNPDEDMTMTITTRRHDDWSQSGIDQIRSEFGFDVASARSVVCVEGENVVTYLDGERLLPTESLGRWTPSPAICCRVLSTVRWFLAWLPHVRSLDDLRVGEISALFDDRRINSALCHEHVEMLLAQTHRRHRAHSHPHVDGSAVSGTPVAAIQRPCRRRLCARDGGLQNRCDRSAATALRWLVGTAPQWGAGLSE